MDDKTRYQTKKWIKNVRNQMIDQFRTYWKLMDALDRLEEMLNE